MFGLALVPQDSISSAVRTADNDVKDCRGPPPSVRQSMLFVEVIRPSKFYTEGNDYNVTIAITNGPDKTRSFETIVRSYPVELSESVSYAKKQERTDEILAGETFCFNHEFFTTWDGAWAFNVYTEGTGANNTRPLIANETGHIKVQSRAVQEMINSNALTRELVVYTIIAAVGGVSVASIAVIVSSIQTAFLIRSPKLRIVWDPEKNLNLHEPELTVRVVGSGTECGKPVPNEADARYVERKHLRVIIQNTGARVAKDCTASIQLLSKDSGCKASSFEPKPLRWVSPVGDVTHKADIAPEGEQYLEVFFADDCIYATFENLGCGIDSKDCSLRAYVSAPLTYRQPWNYNQDGFCRGKFTVQLKVFGGDSKPAIKKFQLEVSENWQSLSMKNMD